MTALITVRGFETPHVAFLPPHFDAVLEKQTRAFTTLFSLAA